MGPPLRIRVPRRDAAVFVEPGQGLALGGLQDQVHFRVVVDQFGDGVAQGLDPLPCPGRDGDGGVAGAGGGWTILAA